MEKWSTFAVIAGGPAAGLTGLLFVAGLASTRGSRWRRYERLAAADEDPGVARSLAPKPRPSPLPPCYKRKLLVGADVAPLPLRRSPGDMAALAGAGPDAATSCEHLA